MVRESGAGRKKRDAETGRARETEGKEETKEERRRSQVSCFTLFPTPERGCHMGIQGLPDDASHTLLLFVTSRDNTAPSTQ